MYRAARAGRSKRQLFATADVSGRYHTTLNREYSYVFQHSQKRRIAHVSGKSYA